MVANFVCLFANFFYASAMVSFESLQLVEIQCPTTFWVSFEVFIFEFFGEA